MLTIHLLLAIYDPSSNLKTELYMNASSKGAANVLLQRAKVI